MLETRIARVYRSLVGFAAVMGLLLALFPASAFAEGPGPNTSALTLHTGKVSTGGAPLGAVPAATLSPPSTIDVRATAAVVFSGDGSRAYAVGGDVLSVIDVGSDTVAGTVAVPGARSMVLSRDGSTAVVSAGGGTPNVSIVDLSSMTVTGVVILEHSSGKLAVSPDGSTVYASEDAVSARSVVAIDVAARKVKAVIPVGAGPGLPVFVAGGSKVYVANMFDGTLSVVNPATYKVSKTIQVPAGASDGALSPDGTRMYYPMQSPETLARGFSVVSVATDTVVATIRTTSVPSTPVFTPDGKTGYTVDQEPPRYVNGRYEAGAYFVAKLDLVNNTSAPLANGYSGRSKPVVQVSADGKRLYIVGSFALVQSLPSNKILATEYLGDNLYTFTLEPGGSRGYGTYINGTKITVLDAPVIEHVRRDYNSDGATDVLARDANGALWLYPGNGAADWLQRKQVGSGWNVMNLVATPGDFNGDRKADVLARDSAGDLSLYPGNGTSDWLPRTKVGTGWNSITAVVTPGDVDFDGKADIVARDTAGVLWLYPGNGKDGWLPRTAIGAGWNEMTAILGPGNTSEPGNDLLARDRSGNLWLCQRTPQGAWLDRRLVGIDWNGMTAMLTPGDVDGDDRPDLLARDTAGALWLYPGTDSGGYDPRVRVGVGWNVMTVIT